MLKNRKPPPAIIVFPALVVLSGLPSAVGLYLILWTEYVEVGIPLMLYGVLFICSYFLLRRTVKKEQKRKGVKTGFSRSSQRRDKRAVSYLFGPSQSF